jgi:hypothetical protein
MDPEQWGPLLWYEMHMYTFRYPVRPNSQDKADIINYFREIGKVLPCEKCRVHYRSELEMYPIENFVGSREDVSRWLVDLHNRVNVRLGKEHFSYEKAKRKYLRTDRIIKNLFIILLLCLVILLLLGKWKNWTVLK